MTGAGTVLEFPELYFIYVHVAMSHVCETPCERLRDPLVVELFMLHLINHFIETERVIYLKLPTH